ncbi:MAG: type II secretion system protein [Candidatus Riflebacteria bacterium]|nr:type II secretion system protein [Candidatus Riflebacteria bacterium]
MKPGGRIESAFSLLELIVVVSIIGIMILVVMPYYNDYVSDRHKVMESNLKS